MLTYADNIAHCLHCDQREEGCAGACKCTKSTRDITEHAREGVCPLDLYGKTHPPERKRKHKGDFAARHLALIPHAIELLPKYPEGRFEGRGIVMSGGGLYFDSAYCSIHIIRSLGCDLDIELWFLEDEFSSWMEEALAPLRGVHVVHAPDVLRRYPAVLAKSGKEAGYQIKPYALLNSRFREAVWVDSDAYFINPEFESLFDSPQFKETGAIFFPDSRDQDLKPHQWAAVGLEYRDEPAFESGVIFIDKTRCWRELNMALWLNERGPDHFYKVFLGDKDLFAMGFRLLNTPYAMPSKRWTWPDGTRPPESRELQAAMIQHDFDGDPLFVHRTVSKLSLTDSTDFNHFTTTRQIQHKRDDRLPMESEAWRHLEDLRDIRSRYLVLHRLESNGDLLTLLPALKYLSRDREVIIITHRRYVSLVEGIPWLKVIPYDGSAQDVTGAILIGRHLGELRDLDPGEKREKNWSLACWARTGVPVELFHTLPLEIENRDRETEQELVAKCAEGTRPLLLLNTLGKSSPYPHGDLLRDFLRQYADSIQILDLAFVQSPRIIDLLGLYERACCLISTDTGTLHLGYATLTPTIALVNDPDAPGPTPHVPGWRASEARSHWVETLTYSESATAAGLKRIGEAMEKVFHLCPTAS